MSVLFVCLKTNVTAWRFQINNNSLYQKGEREMASLAQTKKVQYTTTVSPLVQSAANKATSQKSSTPGTSMGGNVSAPTTVYTTSAATRSANARNAGAGSSNAATVSPQSVIKPGNTLDYTPLNKYNTVSEYTDGGWYGGDKDALAKVYENAGVPYTPTTNTGSGGNGTKYQEVASNSSNGGSGGGGYSTASLIGNLVTDPTAEIRSRYAGILADLANNNQYVLDKLKGNYDTSVNTINADYDTALNRQNQDAENALREAYINMMLNRKNMASDMSRMGYNGGVTESNQARMYNNYGNIRNSIRNTLANALENLNLKRNASLGEALNQYNAQLADQASDYFNKKQNYETALANAIANLSR